MRGTTARGARCGDRALGGLLGLLAVLVAAGCEQGPKAPTEDIPVVDFTSETAELARQEACAANYTDGARVGAARDLANAPAVWSVSPYWVLLPSDGVGYIDVTVDAPHYDWLLYTDEGVLLEALEGPEVRVNGPVQGCPELRLVELGAHQHDTLVWPLRLTGEPGARVRLYATLSATPHSDPTQAGHYGEVGAGHSH